ncbi:MAG: hypothetical protein JWM57_2688 [Phycisphaerales bacterium]|nr:hypothetical protein [Phycisphaerales bacterium]
MDIIPPPSELNAPPPTVSPNGEDLDVDRIEADELPVRKLTHVSADRGTAFTVVIQRSTLNAMHVHGKSDTAVEVCGVLVGELRHDRISPYLLITANIAGDKASSRQTQVTFTAETWNMVQAEMEAKHPDKKVVGWYHTHPGFGVFLSGMDLFIQDNFFNLAWQVAWVYDPLAEIDGVFVWRLGKSVKADFLIEEDVDTHGHDFRSTLAAGSHPVVVTARRTRREQLANLALLTLVFLACFGIIWYGMVWMASHGFRVRLPIER